MAKEINSDKHDVYSSAKITPPPLVENPHFKSVKNMIIRAVIDMQVKPILSEIEDRLLPDDAGAMDAEQSEPQAEAVSLESEQDGKNAEPSDSVMVASTIFGLFVSLSRAIEDDYNRSHKKLQSKVDSKIQQMIRKHKQELGIREYHGMTMQ